MASFKLSEHAKADLTRLYLYGLENFGEAQADRYYDALFDRFEELTHHSQGSDSSSMPSNKSGCIGAIDS